MLFPELKDLIQLKSVINNQRLLRERSGNQTQGDYTSLFQGIGVEFETVRPYVIGDDVRYIDWRVTARIGKPHVKTFRAESDRNVFIVIDANAYMRFGTRGTFKSVQAARAAALLAWKSVQQQDRVGGLVFGDIPNGMQYFKPAKTDAAILQFLKLLCNKTTDQHDQVSVPSALDHLARVMTPQSLVFIISDFSMCAIDELQKSLVTLRKRGKVVLLPVYDPADAEIPDIGAVVFSNNTDHAQIDTHNVAARMAYKKLWQKYQADLQHLAKKVSAPTVWLQTALDPIKCLFSNTGSLLSWKR